LARTFGPRINWEGINKQTNFDVCFDSFPILLMDGNRRFPSN